jgi:hypothetical protein
MKYKMTDQLMWRLNPKRKFLPELGADATTAAIAAALKYE